MDKGKVVGLVVLGLVVVGAVTVVQYLKKPRKNSDGFFNASGGSKVNLKTCKRLDGSYYQEQKGRACVNGAKEVTKIY
jgi:hypothetical protein